MATEQEVREVEEVRDLARACGRGEVTMKTWRRQALRELAGLGDYIDEHTDPEEPEQVGETPQQADADRALWPTE